MAPVAGSAYTYTYATLGEIWAWMIGWDLVLEYAMSCAVVARALGPLSRRIPAIDLRLAYSAAVALRPGHQGARERGRNAGLVQFAGRTDHGRRDGYPGGRRSRKRHDQCHAGAGESGRRAVRHRARLELCAISPTGRRCQSRSVATPTWPITWNAIRNRQTRAA